MLRRILVESSMINMVMLLEQDRRIDDCYLDFDEEPEAFGDRGVELLQRMEVKKEGAMGKRKSS